MDQVELFPFKYNGLDWPGNIHILSSSERRTGQVSAKPCQHKYSVSLPCQLFIFNIHKRKKWVLMMKDAKNNPPATRQIFPWRQIWPLHPVNDLESFTVIWPFTWLKFLPLRNSKFCNDHVFIKFTIIIHVIVAWNFQIYFRWTFCERTFYAS